MRRLAMFAGAFALAVGLCVWALPMRLAPWAAVCLLASGLAFLFFRAAPCRRVRICALGAAAGLLWCWGYERWHVAPLRALCGEQTELTATICQTPQETAYGCSAVARLPGGGRVLLYLEGGAALGDTVTVTARVVDVSRGSDGNLYYPSHGISLLAFSQGTPVIAKAERLPLFCWPARAGEFVRARIAAVFPPEAEGFLRALLTGDRSDLPFQTRNAMSITGISHIVAVSGMHVSMIAVTVRFLCRRRRGLACALCIGGMVSFAAMLGFPPSATRAVLMNVLVLLAPVLGRENDPATSLSLALLVLLGFNPWAIADISLQLSFLAMAGLLFLTPRIVRPLLRRCDDSRALRRLPLLLRICRLHVTTLAASLGANALLLPLLAEAFGTVSLLAPLTNCLLTPLLSAVFLCGFLLTLLALPAPALVRPVGWLLAWPVRLALRVMQALAKLPFAALYTNSPYVVFWVAAICLMLLVFWWMRRAERSVAVLAGCLAATAAAACGFSAAVPGTLAVTAFDVGQGQCILLQSGDYLAIVDCGGDEGAYDGEQVARALLMAGRQRVDALILTHYDTDHTCGAEQLLSRIEVGELLLPDVPDGTGNRAEILAAARQSGTSWRTVSSDETLAVPGGTLSLLTPEEPEANNASLAALLSVGGCDVLVTGDLSTRQEEALLRTHELPDLEVLVAGHHGADSSTGTALLEQTAPDVVLISAGENSYGHPGALALARIAEAGATAWRTDENGQITIYLR